MRKESDNHAKARMHEQTERQAVEDVLSIGTQAGQTFVAGIYAFLRIVEPLKQS